MFGTISKSEKRQVWKVVKQTSNVKVLELGNGQTKYFVTDGIQNFANFVFARFWFEIVKQVLHKNFNVCLFVTVTVLFFLYILHPGIFDALLLPVKLVVDIASCNSDWQLRVRHFYDWLQNSLIGDSCQMGVLLKVLGDNFLCDFGESFYFVWREGSLALFLCFHNCFSDVSVVQCFSLFSFFGFLPRCLSRGSNFLC